MSGSTYISAQGFYYVSIISGSLIAILSSLALSFIKQDAKLFSA